MLVRIMMDDTVREYAGRNKSVDVKAVSQCIALMFTQRIEFYV